MWPVDQGDWLAERFEEHRAHLRAVAYRMLGSLSEADDAVQDAWLRVSRAGMDGVQNLRGWLTTVVARVWLNMLESRMSRREELLGIHLPDPIVAGGDRLDPEQEALLVRGARAAAEQALRFSRLALARPAVVNGAAGVVAWTPDGRPLAVMAVTIARARIVAINILADPVRLRQLDLRGFAN
jgi:Sigma-70 region 2